MDNNLNFNSVINDENYLQLTVECLLAFREFLFLITKLPLKKSKKMQGQKFVGVVDNLIKFYESEKNVKC